MSTPIPDFDEWVKKRTPRDRVFGAARSEGISDDVAEDYLKVTKVESGHNVNVRKSPKGARGFGQVMPDTRGGNVRTVGDRKYDLRDPDQNITAGLRYFAEGGEDPVARRLHYFGGPKARERYERTGRIPNISDGNMTASQYVRATGGQRQPPKFDEWTPDSGVPRFDDWAKDSEQTLPPSRRAKREPSVSPSTSRRSAPNNYWDRIRARMDATKPPVRQRDNQAPIDKTVPSVLDMLLPKHDQPRTFEEDIARRTAEETARANAYRELSKQGVKVNAIRRQVEADLSKPETYSDQFGTRQRMSKPDYEAVEAETLRRAQASLSETQRKGRVAKVGNVEYAMQAAKSPYLGAAAGAGTLLKGLAVAGRKIVDQVADTRGFDTEDSYVYRLGDYIQKKTPEILRSNPDLEQEFFVGKAPNAIGQSALFLLGGVATQSPKLAVSILGGGMVAGDAYDEVKARGGSEDEAVNAGLIAGAILGPSELLGLRGAMNAIKGTVQEATLKAALKTALREGRKDVIENAVQEAGQELGQGFITGNRRTLPQVAEAAALGGIAGVGTVPLTLATQLGGRPRGAQRDSTRVEPAGEPITASRPAEGISETPVALREGETGPATDPTTAQQAQRLYRKDWGVEVEVLPDQSDARPSRVKVAEVGNPERIGFARQSDLVDPAGHYSNFQPRRQRGEGKGQFKKGSPEIPVKSESAEAPNLESGIVDAAQKAPPISEPAAITPQLEGGPTVENAAEVATRKRTLFPQVEGETSPVSPSKSTETTAAGFKSDLSLSQFVRKMGGIVPAEMYRGELDRLRLRDTGTTGLINQTAKQGNVKQTADIMMQAANDAGYRDPKTGEPFENPGDFLYAVERDVAGDKIRVRTGDEDFSAEEARYYAEQEARLNAEQARVDLLEGGRGAELYDKIDARKATNAEREEFRNLARQRGLSDLEIEDIIAGDSEASGELQAASRPGSQPPPAARAEQLGFVQEGLTQQTAPFKSTSQRDALIRSEQQRQAELNPERTAALARLEEIKRRGMTVDDYARQPDLMGNVPSADEIAQLRQIEQASVTDPKAAPGTKIPNLFEPESQKPSENQKDQKFGPGTMRAGEPLPEVKERKFGKRFVEDERIAEEVRDIGTARFYEPIPNKITVSEARKLVDKRGVAESIRIIKDETNNVQPHIRSVMGQLVIQRLNRAYSNLKESNPTEAERVLETAIDLAEWQMDYGTRLGQGVQSFAVWSNLTPEGQLLAYKRFVNKARKRYREKHSEEVDQIVEVANKEGMTDAERLEALKGLIKTNKTARKIKSDLDRIIKAAKTGKLGDNEFYDIVGERLGLPAYNPEVAKKITELALQIEAAPEGLPRNKIILELQRFIAQQRGFDVADLPLGIFYGNILSGYNTHAVNFSDTGLNVLSEINGLALINPRAAAKIYSGLLRGFAEGRFDALLELTRGRMVTDGKWLDVPRLMEVAKFGQKGGVPIKDATKVGKVAKRIAESKIAIPLNAYKYVTRAMVASDALMFRAAKEARASLLAYRMAQAEGLSGGALEARVREILALDRESDFMAQAKREGFEGKEAEFRAKELREMARPTDLSADAAEFAGEATYNHAPHGTLGLIAERVGKLSEDVKPLKLFVPFTRIVANVTNRGLNYTPYGYKRAFIGWGGYGRAPVEPLTAEGRRLMFTRATVGTAGMVLLGVMQQVGVLQIHGNGPSDREKRRQLTNAGWRPYSLQIGDMYLNYMNTPLGLGLSILGNMSDGPRYNEMTHKDAGTRAAYAIMRAPSAVFSQSFLSGLGRLFDALSDDSYKSRAGWNRALSGTVSGLTTPNLARDLYRLFDPNVYQSTTLTEDLVKSTLFAPAIGLKPTLNAFGEPVTVQRQRFAGRLTSDPAWRFVIQKGLRVPVPSRTTEIEKDKRISPGQYYELLKKTGPEVKQWILDNQQNLQLLPEQDAQDELQSAATAIRKRALDEMRGKMVKPMKPPAPPKPEAPARP